MRVLIAGGGGREHALAWRLAQEPGVTALFCAPGNAGIAAVARARSDRVTRSRCAARARRARRDRSHRHRTRAAARSRRRRSLPRRGPARASARRAPPRSSSAARSFAKGFMARHGIPTARYRVCESAADARAADRVGGVRLSRRAEGRRARGRKGRGRRRGSRRGRRRDPRRDGRAAVRRRRRAPRHRGMPGRPGGVVLRALRRHARDPDRLGAGSQAHLRRRPGAEHRRHGGVRAEPAARRRRCRRAIMRGDHRPGAARHARRRHRVPRLPLRRA